MPEYNPLFDATAVDTPAGMTPAVALAAINGVPSDGTGLAGEVFITNGGIWSIEILEEIIATRSPVSTLIHTAINIDSTGTPVPTKGLDDYKITPESVARSVMNRYRIEVQGMAKARAKVKGVS